MSDENDAKELLKEALELRDAEPQKRSPASYPAFSLNFSDDEIDVWDQWFSENYLGKKPEETKEGKCTCGISSVYGPSYPSSRHPDYCDIKRDKR